MTYPAPAMKRRQDAGSRKQAPEGVHHHSGQSESITDEAFERFLDVIEERAQQCVPPAPDLSPLAPLPDGNVSSPSPTASASPREAAARDPLASQSTGHDHESFPAQDETADGGNLRLDGEHHNYLADGTLIDAGERYTSDCELGRGGMGIVLRAWDRNLDRPVAKKVLHLPPRDSRSDGHKRQWQLIDRFFREARITGRLAHPGVVPVHELGRDSDGGIFFTMRIVSGTRLDKVFRLAREGRDGWNQTRVLNVLIRVCDTLAYAHSKGVIHRDLKPANIMVGKYGETYVMDWGAAKYVGERDHELASPDETACTQLGIATIFDSDHEPMTMSGQVLGTPPYMPPEQADGLIQHLDERSDIYSVGAMLYEVLAGTPPYLQHGRRRGPNELVRDICEGPPPEIQTLNKKAPTELVAVCEKAMSRRQGDRYATMDALAEDLRRFLENRVVRAYRTGAAAELCKWVRRNRGVAVASAAAAATALAGLLAIIGTEKHSKDRIKAAFDREYRARKVAESLHLATSSSAVRGEDPTLSFLLATEAYRCDPSVTARNTLYAALQHERESRTLLGHTAEFDCAAVSPDGKWIVSGGKDHVAALWDVDSGQRKYLFIGHRGTVTHTTFSPDNSMVLTASADGSIRVWDVASGALNYVCQDHRQSVNHAAFSSDGKYVATASRDKEVRVYNAKTGAPHGHPLGHPASVRTVAFHPQDSRILATGSRDAAILWDLSTSQSLAVLGDHPGVISALSFSADGARLVTAVRSNPNNSRTVPPENLGGKQPDAPAVCIWNCDVADLLNHADKAPPKLDPLFQLAGADFDRNSTGRTITTGAISADGTRVALGCNDGTVLGWDLPPDREPVLRELTGHTKSVRLASFSPNDERILTLARDNTIRSWHADSGRLLRTLDGRLREFETACFDPHGRFLLTAAGNELRLWPASGVKPVLLGRTTEVREFEMLFNPTRPSLLLTIPIASSQAQLWDISRNTLVAELEHDNRIASHYAHFSPDGSRLVTGTSKGRFFVWDGQSGELINASDPDGRSYQSVSLSADGSFLMAHHRPVLGDSEAVDLWRHDQAGPVSEYSVPEGASARILNGTKILVSVAPADDQAVADETILYDFETEAGVPLPALDIQTSIPIPSADGQRLVTFRRVVSEQFQLWDLVRGDQIPIDPGTAHQHPLSRVTFSPNSERFLTMNSHRVKVWDAKSGQQVFNLSLDHPAENAFFSPDGTTVVVTSRVTGAAVLFSPDREQVIWELGGKDVDLKDVTFTPNGTLFAGRMWEHDQCALFRTETGELIAYLGGSSPIPCKPCFNSKSEWLATANTEGTIHFWPASLDDVMNQSPPRTLTPDEVDQYRITSIDEGTGTYRLKSALHNALEELTLVRTAVKRQSAEPGKALEHCRKTLQILRKEVTSRPELTTDLRTALREIDNLDRKFRAAGDGDQTHAALLGSHLDKLRDGLIEFLSETPGR